MRARWSVALCCGVVLMAWHQSGRAQQAAEATVSGSVRTADGESVGGLAAVLLPPADAAGVPVQCAAVADGAFQFTPVPVGAYRLALAPEGIIGRCEDPAATSGLKATFPVKMPPTGGPILLRLTVVTSPEVRIVSAAMSMTVVRGGPGGVARPPGAPRPPAGSDPGRAGPGRPPAVMRPGAISGRVTDPDGRPIQGVPVQAARRSGTGAAARLLPYSQAMTAADGTYRIANVPDGDVLVIALSLRSGASPLDPPVPAVPSVAGDEGRRVALLTTYFPGVDSAARARPVPVAGGEVGGIDLVMRRGPVTKLTVRVRDPGPAFIPAGSVVLLPATMVEQISGRNVRRAEFRQDGSATFEDVPDGRYLLGITAPAGWARQPLAIDAAAGAIEHVVDLRPFVSLTGRVEIHAERVDASAATKDLQVELRPAPLTSGSPGYRAPVSADGTFRFPRVAGWPYTLTVAGPTFWIPISSTINGRDTLDFPMEMTEEVTGAVLVLADRDTNLRGTVRAADNAPVMSARVVVYAEDRQYWQQGSRRVRVVTVAPGGSWGVTGLPPGDYLAKAFPADARITNAVLDSSRATATPFSLAIGESRVVDLLLVR